MNRQDADKVLPLARAEGGCACDIPSVWPVHPEADSMASSGCGLCPGNDDQRHTACGFGVEGGVLAAVWVPLNRFADLYDADTALRRGTLFAALDKPFYGDGKEVDCRGNAR